MTEYDKMHDKIREAIKLLRSTGVEPSKIVVGVKCYDVLSDWTKAFVNGITQFTHFEGIPIEVSSEIKPEKFYIE